MNRSLRAALLSSLAAFALAASAPHTPAGGDARAQTPAASAAPQAQPTPQRDEKLWKRALALHKKAIVVDGHNDIPSIMVDEDYDIGVPSAGKYHTDIARLKRGGMTGEFFSIYVDRQYATPDWVSKNYVKEGGSARRALDLIDVTYRMVEKYPDDLTLATSTDDIRRAKRQGKVGVLMGIEGGHAIENSLSALREFYRLGVRYMTLTHNNTNEWADACCDEARHNGLSDFGKEVVREMNRTGILVDLSHVGNRTTKDAIIHSEKPVAVTHANPDSLFAHKRNKTDDVLKVLAEKGGVLGCATY
ncbi:MAG TPA: dipeptidase, partial [Pyrinomonadaceae bacterium]|nr:dipeptidase [Pyrinomonadaceae bacterium]